MRNCDDILNEVLELLGSLIETRNNNYLKNVSMIFDSVAIQKEVVYDNKADVHKDYIDLGVIVNITLKS